MKFITPIIFLAIISSCSTNSKYTYVTHLDEKKMGNEFIDSLLNFGVDTIVSYYDGCWGCYPGSKKSFYIYWEHKGNGQISKITNYAQYPTYKVSFKYAFAFMDSIVPYLREEKFDREFSIFDHYSFEEFAIVSPDNKYSFMITEYVSKKYQSSYSVLVIDKFKSMIYQCDRWIGPGYNWKREKRKHVPNVLRIRRVALAACCHKQ